MGFWDESCSSRLQSARPRPAGGPLCWSTCWDHIQSYNKFPAHTSGKVLGCQSQVSSQYYIDSLDNNTILQIKNNFITELFNGNVILSVVPDINGKQSTVFNKNRSSVHQEVPHFLNANVLALVDLSFVNTYDCC